MNMFKIGTKKGVVGMEFGRTLRMMRKDAGLNQDDMAAELDIARSSISKLENDKLDLRAEILIKWCRITNNPDVLMALYAGVDAASTLVASGATTFITGTITFLLGGIL